MTLQTFRFQYLCLVPYAFALLSLMHTAVGLAQEVVDPTNADQQSETIERTSELPYPEFTPAGPFKGPLEIQHIARFNQLPMRMHFEPYLIGPEIVPQLDSRFVPLFDKTLREMNDIELLETAALSLARVAHENLEDISGSTDILLRHVESHSNLRVRFACAQALVNANVTQSAAAILQLNEYADDAQRLWIDPALAGWKLQEAGDMWKQRLTAKSETTVAVSLACDGLAALGDSSVTDLLFTILQNNVRPYEKRKAAARAISLLAPDRAFAAVESFASGSVLERLLAIELLSTANSEAHARLFQMCADESDGVASAAWVALLIHNPESLVEALPMGRSHRDAVVRMTAAHIMRRYPDAERTGWLHEQMSDKHLEVRNVARAMSVLVAEEQAVLREGIISMAGDTLAKNRDNWQGIEQSLLLLGQLRATQFADRCVPLLEHSHNEVLVTSAWLLHLYPDEAVHDAVRKHLRRNEAMFNDLTAYATKADVARQSSFLIQYAGLERLKDLQPLLEVNFSKSSPGGAIKRAAAMWALGIFHENDPDPNLAKSFIGRLADRGGMMPELTEVRRMSAVALGLMREKSAASGLQDAYDIDPVDTVIPDSARWSLGMIGEPLPEAVKPYAQALGGWKLTPVEK